MIPLGRAIKHPVADPPLRLQEASTCQVAFVSLYQKPGLGGFRAVIRQAGSKIPNSVPVIIRQLDLQGVCQRTFQTSFPTRSNIVQVGTSSWQLPAEIDHHAFITSHQADQATLGKRFPAANTSPLWNMFNAGVSFLNHRNRFAMVTLPIRSYHLHACGPCGRWLYRDPDRKSPRRISSFSSSLLQRPMMKHLPLPLR